MLTAGAVAGLMSQASLRKGLAQFFDVCTMYNVQEIYKR